MRSMYCWSICDDDEQEEEEEATGVADNDIEK
jgi:hypothetical protein